MQSDLVWGEIEFTLCESDQLNLTVLMNVKSRSIKWDFAGILQRFYIWPPFVFFHFSCHKRNCSSATDSRRMSSCNTCFGGIKLAKYSIVRGVVKCTASNQRTRVIATVSIPGSGLFLLRSSFVRITPSQFNPCEESI